jgi:hypothetical protein
LLDLGLTLLNLFVAQHGDGNRGATTHSLFQKWDSDVEGV